MTTHKVFHFRTYYTHLSSLAKSYLTHITLMVLTSRAVSGRGVGGKHNRGRRVVWSRPPSHTPSSSAPGNGSICVSVETI